MQHASLVTATILTIIFLQGCAVQKELVPTGGSRADGGSTKSCIIPTNNGCTRWLVSIEYQCTESTLIITTQPSNPEVTQPSSVSKASERMTYIKELKDKGLLSQDEYEAKRKEILKDL